MVSMQKPKAQKVSGGKKLGVHPPYAQMIKEAIVSLKERSGSSQMAIAKFVEEKHKAQNLSPNFKKLLLSQLKKLVASGNLIKIKNSFKLAAIKPKKVPSKTAAKPKKVPSKTATKLKKVPSKTATKPKISSKIAAKKTKLAPAKAKVMKAKKPKSVKSPAKKKVKN